MTRFNSINGMTEPKAGERYLYDRYLFVEIVKRISPNIFKVKYKYPEQNNSVWVKNNSWSSEIGNWKLLPNQNSINEM